MTPLVSVVSGTFNRLSYLQKMVESVRFNIPVGVSYELIIIDGGSTDGTLVWCKQQKDIRLIEHGALLGAIRAFTEGAEVAKGDFVLLANDDVAFTRGTLMRAVTYLETHPKCGIVAICDDRPIFGIKPEDMHRYKVQTQDARNSDGSHFAAIYAQLAVVRRWLGDLAGWWGYRDEVMSKARTYGGDNYLTSRVLEMGYSVEMVPKCNAHDSVPNDDLRKQNAAANDRAFYEVYPDGPMVGSKPLRQEQIVVMPERLRVLYMPIYEPGVALHKETKRGLRDALAKRCLVYEWDYLGTPIHAEDITGFAPHMILSQYHDANWSPLVDDLRKLCPDSMFVNWDGDARGLVDEPYLEMLRKLDLQLIVNAAALPVYASAGIPADYWQIGFEESAPYPYPVPGFDVLFLGNCYNDRRRSLGTMLRTLDAKVGIYGALWNRADGECLYNFDFGAALYQNCRVAISDTFYDGKTQVDAFVSNRLFQSLAAGAFVLHEFTPNLNVYTGLKADVHYASWAGLDDLKSKIERYLHNDKAREKIAKAGQEFVLANFSFDAQVKKLFVEILPKLKGSDHAQLQENPHNGDSQVIQRVNV